MNNQWNNNQFQPGLPSQGSQVQMFDPTKFQAPTAHGGTQTSRPRLHARQQNTASQNMQQSLGAPNTQQNVGSPAAQQAVGAPAIQQNLDGQALQQGSSAQHAQSSWNSWSSWDWNPEATSHQPGNQPLTQQPGSAVFEHVQPQSDGTTGGNQYYGDGTYSNTWNQGNITSQYEGWDASSQYTQPQQEYSQPEPGALYQSQQTQPHQSQPTQPHQSQVTQPHQSQETQPHQSQVTQPHQSQVTQPYQNQPTQPHQSQPNQPYQNQPTQPHQNQPTQPHQSQPNQPHQSQPTQPYQSQESQSHQSQPTQPHQSQWDHQNYAKDLYNQGQHDGGTIDPVHFNTNDANANQQQYSQQNQLSFSGQFYDSQQPQQTGTDQGQVYSHGYEQYQSQADSLYSEPYGTGTWGPSAESGQWATGNQGQPWVIEQQLNSFQNSSGEARIPQPSQNLDTAVARPSFDSYNADDDGTVSGFFGKDDDGDVQLDSQRHAAQNYGGDGFSSHGGEASSGLNQFLAVAPHYHRTDSGISNASLSTFNFSNSEDDDGRKQGQTTEEADLALRGAHDKNISIVQSSSGDNSVIGQHHSQDISGIFLQKHAREDYPGFDSNTYTPHNLPLDTDITPSSIGDHPDSAESGGSAGSSGLTDWEIVPAQSDSVSLSHSSSLDNTSSYLDKPDGGVSIPSSYSGFEPPSTSQQGSHIPLSSASHDNPGLRNGNLPGQSLPNEPQNTFTHETPYSHNDTAGQSLSSSVSASFSDHQQKNVLAYTSPQPPSQASTGVQLPIIPSVPQPDRTANQYKKEGGHVPGHTIPSHPPSNNASLNIQGTDLYDRKPISAQHSLDSEKLRNSSTVPSFKPKAAATSEDGSCTRNRDTDLNINSPDTKPTKSVPPNPEESSHHQRHHSAFQPVGRQQQPTTSASLWDNSEAPTGNILLAPIIPLIIPALNPYSAAAVAEQTTAETSTVRPANEHNKSRERKQPALSEPNTSVSSAQRRGNENKAERNKDKEQTGREDNDHSFDSLDEVDAVVEGRRDRSSRHQQSTAKEASYYHRQDSARHDSDRPLSRNNQPGVRSDDVDQYQYTSQQNRKEAYSKGDPYRRQRDYYYKDYVDGSYDDRYDRPRSRQDESHDSRPSSRSGHQEVSRPRSRADYDQERDYYNRAKQRDYGYVRNDYYNDERERYYRYNKEKEARYTRAYYEEYYGAKYAEHYKQLQEYQLQQQQQQQQHYHSQVGRASSRSSDRSSSHSQSRGSTPAVADSPGLPSYSPGPDYYGNRDTHQASHPDYSRDQYNRGYSYEGYAGYYDSYGYGYSGYEGYNQAYDQGRMTPPKYSYPHVRASFGSGGQLVKVLPNRPKDGQPAILDILDIHMVLESCSEAEELRKFPGPLTRGTHKKDVLLFCQQKARACAEDINMIDRESAQLIWRFLELLIKQNGSVVGTDLADLLLEGHEPSTHEYSLHGMKISQSPESLDTVPEGNSEGSNSARESPAVRVASDRTLVNTADGESDNCVDRFRHLLLYGRKKDALECAMKNNLWGHALFLASKMDSRTHANVMTRFANIAMRMNDPLQTLYQIMSGRQPAAVTCVVDDRWGDWRPHLAMILSNQSSQLETTCKSITTLGDTLAAKSYLHASHFCYLMAQVNFGNYFKKTSKIVLVGSSHNLPMEEFATNEAIQCTEVYEYAQALGNHAFFLPHLQIYKYMYACRLTDYGMVSEALLYCEVIANHIQQNPVWFQVPFVKLVCELSRNLHCSDLQQQISGEGVATPLWLQQLESLCGGYDDGSIQPVSGNATPAGFPDTTTGSIEGGDPSQLGQRLAGDPGADVYGQQAQSYPEVPGGQDVNAVSGQAQSWESADQQAYYQQQQQQAYYQQQQQYDYSQWQQTYDYSYISYEEQPQCQQQGGDETKQPCQQTAQHGCEPLTAYGDSLPEEEKNHNCGSAAEANNCTDDLTSLGGSHPDSSSAQLASQPHPHGYETQQLPPRASVSTNETSEDDEDNGGGNDDDDVLDASSAGFDYFGNVEVQRVVAPPHRYRSMSGSSTGSTRRRRTTSGSSTGSIKVSPHKPATQQPAGGKGSDKALKGNQQDSGGSGWFGGLFNKFKAKDKNEMILPDDKDPPIVWDPVKKKWTNSDGTEEDVVPRAPPPKDTDLLGNPMAAAPMSVAPPPSGMTEGNRFSLKAKGARNQYVDVNNPMSVPQNLFPVVPGATLASVAANFPTSGQASSTEPMNFSNIGNVDNSLVISQDPGSQVSEIAVAANVSQQVPSMPVLFNPASLKGGSAGGGSASSAAGPGLKYGQRRAYPK